MPRLARPIVLIGAGGIAQAAHLPAYREAGFSVVAVADQEAARAEEVARAFTIPRSFDSAEGAIRSAPADAVFDLAVPASQLLATLALLPEGACVLMQKPMGETLEEARRIRDLCRSKQLIAAVNFQLRYAPNHLGAVALAREGMLGALHDIEVQVRTFTPWANWSFLAAAPRLEILYHSIHYLDLVRHWLGNPASVYAKTVRSPMTPHLAPTRTSIILDYEDAVRVSILTNHGHDFAAESQLSFVQWEGTVGALRMGMGVNLDYPRGEPDTLAFAQREATKRDWHALPVCGNWFPHAFAGSMGALQAFAEGSTPSLPIGFESAFETMALVEAAYLSSSKGGEPLPL